MTREPEVDALDQVDELDLIDDAVEGETVMVDRGAGAPVVEVEVEVEDRTVVVDRGAGAPAVEVEDRTVVVDRGAAAPQAEVEAEVEDHTVVVDRGAADAEDRTVVVDRSARGDAPGDLDDADELAVADTVIGAGSSARSAAPDEHDPTAVVDRGPRASEARPEASVTAPTPPRRRRLGGRRTLEPAPLEPIDLRSSVRAVGAGAVEYYRPRQLPPASAPPETFDAPPPAREPSPGLPSIRKSSRRAAALALTGLALAVGVGVVGAITVASLLIAG